MRPRSAAGAVALARRETLERVTVVTKAMTEPVSPEVNLQVSPQESPKVRAFIGIGANLGDPPAAVAKACSDIGQLPGTQLKRRSSLYTTAPYEASGPDYVNAVVEVVTSLSPHDLLNHLHQLEHQEARTRPYRNAPRTLDLDILLYADKVIQTPALTIPHPRMNQRAFVLVPLAEIAPERVSAALLGAVSNQPISRLS